MYRFIVGVPATLVVMALVASPAIGQDREAGPSRTVVVLETPGAKADQLQSGLKKLACIEEVWTDMRPGQARVQLRRGTALSKLVQGLRGVSPGVGEPVIQEVRVHQPLARGSVTARARVKKKTFGQKFGRLITVGLVQTGGRGYGFDVSGPKRLGDPSVQQMSGEKLFQWVLPPESRLSGDFTITVRVLNQEGRAIATMPVPVLLTAQD